MSYGHPISSGHGHRIPAYRWSPTVLPPSQRRARRLRYTRNFSSVPRFRFSVTDRPSSAYRVSRQRAYRATPPREPSFGRLLWKGVAFLAEGVVKFLADEALAGRRTSKSFENFLGSLVILAVMSSSAIGLVLGGLYLFAAYMDDFAGGAAAASMEEYDEAKKRMCITRKSSVDAPPTPEELRRAWKAARGRGRLAAKLLTGTLLSNLEPAVDQSYLRLEDGTIVGRRPGLKGWLRGYCPDLVPHYKALMSYKALADKLRVALGIEDPDTLSGVIDFGEMRQKGDEAPFAKSLQFRKRFRLQETNERTVMEGIHSLFTDQVIPEPKSGSAIMGKPTATERENEARAVGKMGEEVAKTSVFSVKYDTKGPQREARAQGEMQNEERAMGKAEGGTASGATTMAALDAAVRERLGLCWMRRAGRRPRPV